MQLKRIYFVFLILSLLLSSCSNHAKIEIIIPSSSSKTVKITAADLKEDLEEVLPSSQISITSPVSSCSSCYKIYLGECANKSFTAWLEEKKVELSASLPGKRGGKWQKIDKKAILIGGSDIQGLQYSVYDFAEEILGIDPVSYWTGHESKEIDISDVFNINEREIAPPLVPLMVYFENDVDELLNLKPPLLEYDWESWTEMIDALVRLRYNGIHLFDLLGRAEFYQRVEYKSILPDYQVNMEYVDSMINYVHDKAMLVQVDLSLGYQFKSLESKYADCWKLHKGKWIDTWKYYLEETPMGKGDIYSLRPRNQVWDWEYKSTCGEDKIDVFTEVYVTLDSIIDAHNPAAKKVVVCYSDAMEMYNEGFRAPDDWIVAWSDDGYGGFEVLPNDNNNGNFGTYMHAGFWKNHTVAHPYPDMVDSVMHMMFADYNADKYCMVNGQQFRPFLFNLEAYSEVCREPSEFTADAFMQDWASRYFDEDLHGQIFQLIRDWDRASFGQAGYVQNLWEIKEVIAYLADLDIQSPGKSATPNTAERVFGDTMNLQIRYALFEKLVQKSDSVYAKTDQNSAFYYDQIHFPLIYYLDLLRLEAMLHEIFEIKRSYELSADPKLKDQAMVTLDQAVEQMKEINQKSAAPTKDPKWNTWYAVQKRRPNNGFPTLEMLNDIKTAIETKW